MYGEGKSWGGAVPVGPRVLTTLSAAGQVLRASNDGAWTASRPRWAATRAWLGGPIEVIPEREGLARLVARWLRAFGPGTANDLRWWLGSTLGAVRRALADVGAVEVGLDGGSGYLRPDDLEPEGPVGPWAALLPPLDPTTMGWIEREWYVGPYKAQLFDSSGNAGQSAWWDGRIVGGSAPAGERRGAAAAAGGRGLRRAAGPGRGGGAPERLAQRDQGAAPLPFAPLEGGGVTRGGSGRM